jgi:F-type H+-transporting ATPase subunit delta
MNPAKLHDTVLDTGAEQLGKIYARALLAAAISAGSTDRVLAELNQLVDDLLRNNPQLATAFASPKITEDEKYRVIDRLFGPTCDPVLVRFLKVMAKRGRLGYLAAVRDAANDLQDEMMGRVVAEVRTAVPLAADLRQAVIERISHSAGKEVRLVEVVDAELVGGMVIRLGDTIFDGSVSRELVEKFATFAGTAD